MGLVIHNEPKKYHKKFHHCIFVNHFHHICSTLRYPHGVFRQFRSGQKEFNSCLLQADLTCERETDMNRGIKLNVRENEGQTLLPKSLEKLKTYT